MSVSRRSFLRNAGGAVFAPSLVGLAACNDMPSEPGEAAFTRLPRKSSKGLGGYGSLAPSVDCPELLIPDGFKVVRVSETTRPSLADSSFIVPQALDGMAAFPLPNGNIRLIRNHEIRDSAANSSPFGANPYDTNAGAGTTSLEVRVNRSNGAIAELELLAEYPSITGTHVNCAGGLTPWNSWITCEETTEGTEQGRAQPHGYSFDVPASATGPVNPVPLKSLGRFVHEALVVDPHTGFVYLTEDFTWNPDNGRLGSGFFRFIPHVPGDLSDGRLQALAVTGRPEYNTVTGQTPGLVLPVSWVDIDDPDPADAATNPSAVFAQGRNRGAAIFQRLEGCWFGDNSVFFNSTSGGDVGAGQVWQYRPLGSRQAQINASGGQLILVFESPSSSILENPDNICVSPRGGLVLCEDGDDIQFVRGITRRGEIFDFVEQATAMAEFAGACYSPDGDILFFNIQGSTSSRGTAFGATYAMWGPWEQGAL
jgi:hypothetical protein